MTAVLAGPDVERSRSRATGLNFGLMYERQWSPMMRLAVGLIDDPSAAETIVADAFVALYREWEASREPRDVLTNLRAGVVRRARTTRLNRGTASATAPEVWTDSGEPADDDAGAVLAAEFELIRSTLRGLPDRVREVLVLRFVAGLTEPEIAAATGLSVVRVRLLARRGRTRIRRLIGPAL